MIQKTVMLEFKTWKKLRILKTNLQDGRFEDTICRLLENYEADFGLIKEE